MNYIITKLITAKSGTSFYLLGQTESKRRAAEIAADAYKAYNEAASFQNIGMVTEWLETRQEYSFRKDRHNRIQLAITALEGETLPEDKQLIYSASEEEDELLRKVSQALMDGRHTAERGSAPPSCPMG